jgi:hypothetical protein
VVEWPGGVTQQLEHDWDVVVGATLHGGSESYVAQATTGDGVQAVMQILGRARTPHLGRVGGAQHRGFA